MFYNPYKKILHHKICIGSSIASFSLGYFLGKKYTAKKSYSTEPYFTPSVVSKLRSLGEFSTLIKALSKTGLDDILSRRCCYTLFAPRDEAFESIYGDTLYELFQDKKALREVLLYHVLEGRVYSASIREGLRLKTLQGGYLNFGESLKVEGASILNADIEAQNGVIHVIDKVLMP